MERVERLSSEEAHIIDTVRQLAAGVQKEAGAALSQDIQAELEQVYHLLEESLNNLMYANGVREVRPALEQARDAVYRLLR